MIDKKLVGKRFKKIREEVFCLSRDKFLDLVCADKFEGKTRPEDFTTRDQSTLGKYENDGMPIKMCHAIAELLDIDLSFLIDETIDDDTFLKQLIVQREKRTKKDRQFDELLKLPKNIVFNDNIQSFFREMLKENSEELLEDISKRLFVERSIKNNPNIEILDNNMEGERLLKKCDFENAFLKFKQALKLEPKNVLSNLGCGYALSKLKQYERANKYYSNAEKFEKNIIKTYLGLAHTYSKMGLYEDSIDACNKALTIDEENVQILFLKAVTLSKFNNKKSDKERLTTFENILSIDKNDFSANYFSAFIYWEYGNYIEAEIRIKRAIALKPNVAFSYKLLSLIQADQERISDAISNIKKAIELDEKNPDFLGNLIDCYVKQAEFFFEEKTEKQQCLIKAKAVLERIQSLECDTEYYNFFYNGIFSYFSDEIPEAENWYKKAIGEDPSILAAYNSLGFLYYRENKYEDAKKKYIQSLKIDPRNFHANENLATILFAEGKHTESIQLCINGLERSTENIYLNALLADCYISIMEYQNAIEHLKDLLGIESENYSYNILIGIASYENGDVDSAITYLNQCKEYSDGKEEYPFRDDGDLNFYLGAAWEEKREDDKALRYYEKTLNLDPNYLPAILRKGSLLFPEGEGELSEKYYLDALKISPECTEFYNQLGNISKFKNENEQAIKYYRAGLKIDENDLPLLHSLSLVQCEENQIQKALQSIQTAINVHPDSAEFYYLKGLCYSRISEEEASIKNYFKAFELDLTEFDSILYPCGETFNKKTSAKLEKCYDELIDEGKYQPLSSWWRSRVRYNLGKYEEALIDINCAIQQSPASLIGMYYFRANIYKKLGLWGAAESDFNFCQELVITDCDRKENFESALKQIERKKENSISIAMEEVKQDKITK